MAKCYDRVLPGFETPPPPPGLAALFDRLGPKLHSVPVLVNAEELPPGKAVYVGHPIQAERFYPHGTILVGDRATKAAVLAAVDRFLGSPK